MSPARPTSEDAPPWSDRHISLIGLSGAGKSTVGRVLADRLSRPFYDLDVEIEKACEQTVSEIFAEHGELGFRAREADILDQILQTETPAVIATGGGAIEWIQSRVELRKRSWVAWLKIDPKAAASRLADDSARPLLSGPGAKEDALARLERSRRTLYRTTAHTTVRADDDPDSVATSVLAPTPPFRRKVALGLGAVGLAMLLVGMLVLRPGTPTVEIERVLWSSAVVTDDGSEMVIDVDGEFARCDVPHSVAIDRDANPVAVEVRYGFDPGFGSFCEDDIARVGDRLRVALDPKMSSSATIADAAVVDGEIVRCRPDSDSAEVICR